MEEPSLEGIKGFSEKLTQGHHGVPTGRPRRHANGLTQGDGRTPPLATGDHGLRQDQIRQPQGIASCRSLPHSIFQRAQILLTLVQTRHGPSRNPFRYACSTNLLTRKVQGPWRRRTASLALGRNWRLGRADIQRC